MKVHYMLLAVLLSIAACNRASQSPEAADAGATEAEAIANTVTLKPEQIEKLGVVTTPAKAMTYAAERSGYGTVLTHDLIAQHVAEVETAEVTARQSRGVLERARGLANTPGAFAAETLAGAERQAAADESALVLAQRKLTAALGQVPQRDTKVLDGLATGQIKLLRITFPLGSGLEAAPRSVRVTRMLANSSKESWSSAMVWDAPADPAIPGRSHFAMFDTRALSEGERVQAWTAGGEAQQGVWLPSAAVVIYDGRYWCYVASSTDTFVRTPLEEVAVVDEGYFVRGIAPGAAVVSTAAGLLLARELNPATEAD